MSQPVSPQTVCIVGGGPAGIVLAYLLARKGVRVTLLEGAGDFQRDFRGDTLQPAVMEALAQLGLAGELHQLDHIKAPIFRYYSNDGEFGIYDMRELRTPFPYIMLIRQPTFLQFMVERAQAYPNFELRLGSRVEALIEEDGAVRGVCYRQDGRLHDLRADLTLGADGRFSKMRQLMNADMLQLSPGQDVLWFKLSRRTTDPADSETNIFLGDRHYVALLEREEHWQVGYSIPKGTFKESKALGVEPIRDFVQRWVPWLANRVDELQDWKQITLLTVEIKRARRWYQPGLLLLGDAAHVISPTGGLGINVAVQDAVASANILTKPLLEGRLTERDLARVQQRRAWQVALIQAFQVNTERENARAFALGQGSRTPRALKFIRAVPILKTLPGWLTAYGVRPERLNSSWLALPEMSVGSAPPSPTESLIPVQLGNV